MYSDRVDSVTRATNPFPPSESPSTSLALRLVHHHHRHRHHHHRRRHLPMHRRIKHGLAVRSSLSLRIVLLPRHLLSLSFVASSRSLASLTRLGRFFSPAPYPSPRVSPCVLVPPPFLLFRHLTLSHPPQSRVFFFFLFFLFFPLLDISLRRVPSHLGNRRAWIAFTCMYIWRRL